MQPLVRFWKARGLAAGPVIHGVFTRLGGISPPPFASLNLGFTTGDDPKRVVKNRLLAFDALGLSLQKAVACRQVHGSEVAQVDMRHAGRGGMSADSALPGFDALATQTPGLPLMAFFADCLPILLWDEARVAVAHAGWRGTVADVAGNTVSKMVEMGADPLRLQVAMGPCIGPCCYEVGDDIIEVFRETFGQEVCTTTKKGAPSVDLVAANRTALVRTGISPSHIETSNYCTACRTDLFFSHRVEGPKTGRMLAVIMLKESKSKP